MSREWFSLDGIQCDDLRIAMLGYTMQPLPDQEVDTLRIPGMNGAHDVFSGAYRQREIIIRCAQLSTDELNLAENLLRIKEWASGMRKLALWDRPGIEYDAYLSGSSEIDNQAVWGEFRLVFLCNPEGVGAVKHFPVGNQFWCSGNSPAPCVVSVTLSGSSDGIEISHALGAAMVDGEFRAGQKLIVDGVKRHVTLDGVGIMPRVSIRTDWPIVVPGQNTITTSVPAVGTVQFAERWI